MPGLLSLRAATVDWFGFRWERGVLRCFEWNGKWLGKLPSPKPRRGGMFIVNRASMIFFVFQRRASCRIRPNRGADTPLACGHAICGPAAPLKNKSKGARRGSINMPPLPGFELDTGSQGRKVIPLKTAKDRTRKLTGVQMGSYFSCTGAAASI